MPVAPGASPEADPAEEARRVVALAQRAGLRVRVLGGVAVRLRCPSAAGPPLARAYGDIDFVARAADREALTAVFAAAGYQPDAEFNGMHGHQRLFFFDPAHERDADVFLDTFRMCHTLELGERLALDPETLPLSDLLLCKLQVVETNEKDYQDALALLADHGLGPDGLDGRHIAAFLAADWGWWRTATMLLERIEAHARELPGFAHRHLVVERIAELRALIDAEPKSRRWKLRAKVGERKRWHELPEDAHPAG